jgi:hypothetical protein
MKNRLTAKMRQRREASALARVMHDASPAMRQELMVLAQRSNLMR